MASTITNALLLQVASIKESFAFSKHMVAPMRKESEISIAVAPSRPSIDSISCNLSKSNSIVSEGGGGGATAPPFVWASLASFSDWVRGREWCIAHVMAIKQVMVAQRNSECRMAPLLCSPEPLWQWREK